MARIKLAPPRRRPKRIAKKVARRLGAKHERDWIVLYIRAAFAHALDEPFVRCPPGSNPPMRPWAQFVRVGRGVGMTLTPIVAVDLRGMTTTEPTEQSRIVAHARAKATAADSASWRTWWTAAADHAEANPNWRPDWWTHRDVGQPVEADLPWYQSGAPGSGIGPCASESATITRNVSITEGIPRPGQLLPGTSERVESVTYSGDTFTGATVQVTTRDMSIRFADIAGDGIDRFSEFAAMYGAEDPSDD